MDLTNTVLLNRRHGQSHYEDITDDPGGWNEVLTGGKTPFADLFAEVAGRVDELSDLGVARIRSAVGIYASASEGHRGDLWWSTKRNIQMMLTCLGQQRGLSPEDLASRRVLGLRAAEHDIALESVMHAIRLGCILVWDALLETAEQQGPAAARSLLESAGLMWLTLDELSTAIADGHRDASAVRDQDARRRSLAFVSALRELPAAPDRAHETAIDLGIDPDGDFVWAAFKGYAPDSVAFLAVVVDNPSEVFGLIVGDQLDSGDEERLASSLIDTGADHVGIGLARQGLLGARQSLQDAEQSHRLSIAWGAPSSCYRRDWLACLVHQSAGQLSDLLVTATDEIASNPELRDTVTAFLENDGHLAAAGRQLHLHPNTVAYRLARLGDLTGLNVRTITGSAEALAVLTLVRTSEAR